MQGGEIPGEPLTVERACGMNETLNQGPEHELSDQMARLEKRVVHLEEICKELLAAAPIVQNKDFAPAPQAAPAALVEPRTDPKRSAEDFEFEVGQNWFAKVGIVALTAGAACALFLPFESLPAGVPSLAGYSVVAVLFLLAHVWRNSLELASRYFRGAAMALLYIATLRLYFVGKHHVLEIDSIAGKGLLVVVVGVNLAIAYYRNSPYLFGLSLAIGYATAIAVNAPWFVLIAIAALSIICVHARMKFDWPGALILGTLLTYITYFNWAANNPFFSHNYHLLTEPFGSISMLLLCISILAAGSILKRGQAQENPAAIVSSFLNCALGYGVYFVHSLMFPQRFAEAHVVASVVFIGLAAMFWMIDRREAATFLYAMSGYMALSAAIIRASGVPDVFVWLSLESLVVVSTAIWFQSRFIIVANFLIYVSIVAAYVYVARRESGISLVLGIVALISARILSWKKERLLLKTELMRNAYLASAFVIFPYAFFHLVPRVYVGLAWVGVALFYYGMNLAVQSEKYRWMGHATLMLTAVYLLIVGTRGLEPIVRILTLLVLGSVLLIVSVIFTKTRKASRK